MRIQSGQLMALGHGTDVHSDEVIAVEPITDGRGPGKRSLVWPFAGLDVATVILLFFFPAIVLRLPNMVGA